MKSTILIFFLMVGVIIPLVVSATTTQTWSKESIKAEIKSIMNQDKKNSSTPTIINADKVFFGNDNKIIETTGKESPVQTGNANHINTIDQKKNSFWNNPWVVTIIGGLLVAIIMILIRKKIFKWIKKLPIIKNFLIFKDKMGIYHNGELIGYSRYEPSYKALNNGILFSHIYKNGNTQKLENFKKNSTIEFKGKKYKTIEISGIKNGRINGKNYDVVRRMVVIDC